MMGGRMPGELSFIVLYGNSPGRSREGQRVENGRRRHHCDGPGNRPGSVNSDLRVVLRCNRWHFQSAITIFRIRKVGIFLIKFPHMTSTSGGANKWEKYARTTSPLPAPPPPSVPCRGRPCKFDDPCHNGACSPVKSRLVLRSTPKRVIWLGFV